MNNDTTNSGKQKLVWEPSLYLKTNVLDSEIGGLRMRTSLQAVYVTSIYFAYNKYARILRNFTFQLLIS